MRHSGTATGDTLPADRTLAHATLCSSVKPSVPLVALHDGEALRTRPPEGLVHAVAVCGILANPLIIPNLTEVVADFDRTNAASGLLVSVIPLSGVFLSPVAGVLADRLGRRPVVVACLVVFGVAGLLSAVATTFHLLLFARFVQGFGSAGLLSLSLVLVADHWKGPERMAMMGRNAAALGLGLAVVPLVSGLLAEATSWRWSLALASFAFPIAALAWYRLPSHVPLEKRTWQLHLKALRASARLPVVSAILTSTFALFVVVFGVFLTTLPIHLDQRYDLGPGARGAVLAVPAAGSIITAMALGSLSRAVSRRSILVVSGLMIACSILTIGVATSLYLLVAATLLYGLGSGVSSPTLQSMAAAAVSADRRAGVLALWVSSMRLGQLAGPLVAGLLLSQSSTQTVMIVGSAAFATVSLFWLWFPTDLSLTDRD